MKGILNWLSPAVVNIYDEVSLWSAPFARLLLENIPMAAKAQILDLGFGTGFPLVELSQRFGSEAKIYGMDIWPAAIARSREKIKVLGLDNIQIFEQSATEIPLADQSIDLICSNLGINNFDNKEQVMKECHRVLKSTGHLCLCTNPMGTFVELFDLFQLVMENMKLQKTAEDFKTYLAHRDTKASIVSDMRPLGFELSKYKMEETTLRFVDAQAVFDYALIRIGFLAYWKKLIPSDTQEAFFAAVKKRITAIIEATGEFKMSIPLLYLEFEKS